MTGRGEKAMRECEESVQRVSSPVMTEQQLHHDGGAPVPMTTPSCQMEGKEEEEDGRMEGGAGTGAMEGQMDRRQKDREGIVHSRCRRRAVPLQRCV